MKKGELNHTFPHQYEFSVLAVGKNDMEPISSRKHTISPLYCNDSELKAEIYNSTSPVVSVIQN